LRDKGKEYQRRGAQPLLVLAQHSFQLKRPAKLDRKWVWPAEVPGEVLFDPLATVSATYGVAFQTRFRRNQGPWSSLPAIFVIDRDGIIRYADRRQDQDFGENENLPILDQIEAQRALITSLPDRDPTLREPVRIALAPLGDHTKAALPALTKALKDKDRQVRAGAAAALYWIAPRAADAVPELVQALQDPDSDVRRLSALALGRIDPSMKLRK
jgi:peroxiredoxin